VTASVQAAVAPAGAPKATDRRKRLQRTLLVALVAVAALGGLTAIFGSAAALQATVNGLVSGSYIGLGAIGLTLVLGTLKVVNLAHGDLLVAGAYLTILFTAWNVPLPLAALLAMAGTSILALATERLVWRPLRRAGAGTLQFLLSAIGLALVIRFTIQFFAGSQVRTLGADVVRTIAFGPLRIGVLQATALAVGLAAMAIVGLGLRHTDLGKAIRAFADNPALAEFSGIEAGKTIDATWILAGFIAGLAGVLYAASIGSFNPNFGLSILLSLFAATLLGGIGNPYGALVGGLLIGLSQEWSTLFFSARWKPVVGFSLLLFLLLFMPRGIFGRGKRP